MDQFPNCDAKAAIRDDGFTSIRDIPRFLRRAYTVSDAGRTRALGSIVTSYVSRAAVQSIFAVKFRLDANWGGNAMAMRPDPTFYPSPKLAMEGPPEEFAYTALLSGDSSKPDALAIIDVKRGSPTYSQVVHTVTMPYKGDEFHHFGWNACSSALSPLTGHAFLKRRYLIIPGIRSSRVYVVDTKPPLHRRLRD
jgi:hypothetical protein